MSEPKTDLPRPRKERKRLVDLLDELELEDVVGGAGEREVEAIPLPKSGGE